MRKILVSTYRGVVPSAVKRFIPLWMKEGIFQTLFFLTREARWAVRKAELLGKQGKTDRALLTYQAALAAANHRDLSLSRLPHKTQFQIERTLAQLESRPPIDPLLEISVAESDSPVFAGTFKARISHVGLNISGKVRGSSGLSADVLPTGVDILIDGQVIRREALIYGEKSARFSFTVKRPTLELFPKRSVLAVRTNNGLPLVTGTAESLLLHIPFATGGLHTVIEERGLLDKKGYPRLSVEELRTRQDEYLELYAKAKRAFDEVIGRPLFLMYGTLLGLYRDGDFIPGDDDFDVGYVSYETTPETVKDEAKEIMLKLVRAGFTIAVNRRGKPFRIRDPQSGVELHLDARPIWYQDDRVWAHKHACLKLPLATFSEVKTTSFRSTGVYIPAGTKKFLKAYYGQGWHTPDPSFSNASVTVPPAVTRNLERSCLTPQELVALTEQAAAYRDQMAETGEFVAIGLQRLYPLEEYARRCGF